MENMFGENHFVQIRTSHEILILNYKMEAIIDLTAIIEITDLLGELCKGKQYYGLLKMENLLWTDKSSRDHFACHPVVNSMKAWAYCSTQPIHKIMFSSSKPRVAAEFFNSEEEGIKWLNSLRSISS